MNKRTQVLIIGAGPTGLSAAILLKMHGIDVHIVDVQTTSLEDKKIAKAITLGSRSIEILGVMGVRESFLKSSIVCNEIKWHKNAKDFNVMDFQSLQNFYTDSPYLIHLPQWEMTNILIKKLDDLHVTVHRGVEFISFKKNEKTVSVTLTQNNNIIEIETDYLLGCDGTKSKVRESIGATLQIRPIESLEFHQLDAIITHFDDDKRRRYTYPLHNKMLTVLPMMNDYQRLVLINSRECSQNITIETFAEVLHEAGYKYATIEDPLWFTGFQPNSALSDKYQEGSIFILGDAAHPITPLTAQGLNTGLQDAYNLCWKLILTLKNNVSPNLLLTYQEERQPVGNNLVDRAEKLSRFTYLLLSNKNKKNFLVNLLSSIKRNILLNLFINPKSMLEYIKDQSQLNISYDLNNFIVKSNTIKSFLKPGSRVPNIPLLQNSQSTFLYSHIAYDSFLLLIYIHKTHINTISNLQKQIELLLADYKHLVKHIILLDNSDLSSEYIEKNSGANNIFMDKDNVFKNHKHSHSYFILIRPDTHIGMTEATDNLPLLHQYFKNFI